MKKTNLDNNQIIEINRHCYDVLGADYTDGASDFEIIQQKGIWQKFLDNLPKGGKKILNVACGTGDMSVWLDKHGYEVVSTDLSSEMIEITSTKLPHAQNLVLGATELDSIGGGGIKVSTAFLLSISSNISTNPSLSNF